MYAKIHFWPTVVREMKCTHHLAQFSLTSELGIIMDLIPTQSGIPLSWSFKEHSGRPTGDTKGRAKSMGFLLHNAQVANFSYQCMSYTTVRSSSIKIFQKKSKLASI